MTFSSEVYCCSLLAYSVCFFYFFTYSEDTFLHVILYTHRFCFRPCFTDNASHDHGAVTLSSVPAIYEFGLHDLVKLLGSSCILVAVHD